VREETKVRLKKVAIDSHMPIDNLVRNWMENRMTGQDLLILEKLYRRLIGSRNLSQANLIRRIMKG
jgi:hypothetical protein